MRSLSFAFCLVTALTACMTSQGRFRPLGTHTYAPKATHAPVEIYREGVPTEPFEKIARIDVHLEKTHFIPSDLNSALPELENQARAAGADAIIDIRERRSTVGETKIYHVTATAIRYVTSE